jgi:phage terminase large subunit GpA-like protein
MKRSTSSQPRRSSSPRAKPAPKLLEQMIVPNPRMAETVADWWPVLKPPPRLTVSQWADARRQLSPEASAEPGRWDTSRAEYQRGIMDSVSDLTIDHTVVIKSAQVGWTEIINNIVGFYIDQDPAPLLVLQPTLAMGEAWSKDRLAPMIRDSACLTTRSRTVAHGTAATRSCIRNSPVDI